MRLIISTNQEDVLERGDVFVVDETTFTRIAQYAKFQALRMNQPPNKGLQSDGAETCADCRLQYTSSCPSLRGERCQYFQPRS